MEKRFPDELNKLDDAKNWGCKDQRKLDMKILRGTQKRIREHENQGEVIDQRKTQNGARQRNKEENIAKGPYITYNLYDINQTKTKPNQKRQLNQKYCLYNLK